MRKSLLSIMRGGWPYRLPCVPQRSMIMRDYKKCIHCDCYNADYGEAESHGQMVDACALCEMTEEEWCKFLKTCE